MSHSSEIERMVAFFNNGILVPNLPDQYRDIDAIIYGFKASIKADYAYFPNGNIAIETTLVNPGKSNQAMNGNFSNSKAILDIRALQLSGDAWKSYRVMCWKHEDLVKIVHQGDPKTGRPWRTEPLGKRAQDTNAGRQFSDSVCLIIPVARIAQFAIPIPPGIFNFLDVLRSPEYQAFVTKNPMKHDTEKDWINACSQKLLLP